MSPKLENKKSQILDDAQNERLFSLIGTKCFTLSTAVAQILPTESDDVDQPANQGPVKSSTVVCLIKDFTRRSYFIRTFDLNADKLLCEIDLLDISKYEEIDLLHHVITERAKTYRLHFKSKTESVPFYDTTQQTLAKKKTRRKSTTETNTRDGGINVIETKKVVEISAPFNFVHLQHVGWNDQLSKFVTTYPQSEETISPYQVVSRKFATCKEENKEEDTGNEPERLMYANEEFAIYNKAEIASIFNTEFLHKFGHFEKICVKSIALPPPPPLPR